jgi:hypothetical protein
MAPVKRIGQTRRLREQLDKRGDGRITAQFAEAGLCVGDLRDRDKLERIEAKIMAEVTRRHGSTSASRPSSMRWSAASGRRSAPSQGPRATATPPTIATRTRTWRGASGASTAAPPSPRRVAPVRDPRDRVDDPANEPPVNHPVDFTADCARRRSPARADATANRGAREPRRQRRRVSSLQIENSACSIISRSTALSIVECVASRWSGTLGKSRSGRPTMRYVTLPLLISARWLSAFLSETSSPGALAISS